jgi:hypothetical protein
MDRYFHYSLPVVHFAARDSSFGTILRALVCTLAQAICSRIAKSRNGMKLSRKAVWIGSNTLR